MSFVNAIKVGMGQIEKILGNQTVLYKGETYDCCAGNSDSEFSLVIGGKEERIACTLLVRRELFTDAIYPTDGEFVTFKGKIHRIGKVDVDGTATVLQMHLVSANRGTKHT